MEFSKKKLPVSAAETMRRCPISSIEPYAPLLAPTYVFMRRNEKFVAVKAPLDFFTPDELARYSEDISDFFVPAFVDQILPVRDIARSTAAVVSMKSRPDAVLGMRFKATEVQATPYEVSDAVLRVVARLWGPKLKLEPFFASVFAIELCGLLEGPAMVAAREQGFPVYELALFRSGMGVLLGLHLGVCDLGYLKRLRDDTFRFSAGVLPPVSALIHEISVAASFLVTDSSNAPITTEQFARFRESLFVKLKGRVARITSGLAADAAPSPTVSGLGGFTDG